ncbi:MAG: type II secretion system F family protein [Verrucomicrobiales bacterium]|nr:type II secretion system F family protein [Verrucomicrobiales bacterium]
MPRYRFIAVDDTGHTRRGYREAADEPTLGAMLRREGQWLAEAKESRRVEWRVRSSGQRKTHRIPNRVLEAFFFSLGIQLEAGVNLATALGFGLEKNASRVFKAVHGDLMERVRAGSPLSDAMAAHPRAFSRVVVQLVRAGEASGRLSEVCSEIRAHFERNERTRSEIRQALVYPTALVLAAVCFFAVVFGFFIPRFTKVLQDLGVPLPWLTKAMIAISGFVVAHPVAIAAAILGPPIAGIFAVRRWPAVARAWDGFKLKLPLIGTLVWQTAVSRLVRSLATLYGGGIPLLDAIRLSQPLLGNRVLEASVERIHDDVGAGRTLHDALSRSALFPPMVVQMAALGESTGTLDRSLRRVADYYDVMLPRAVRKLFSVFEPVVVLTMVVAVGVIVLSVVLPIASALGAQ